MESTTAVAPIKTIIEDLLEKPFGTRSFSEKRLIILNGRPCPKLTLKTKHVKDRKRDYTRNFKETQFSLYPWLTGCENKKKLFCWPCLLFSHTQSCWIASGVDNLNALTTLQKKHQQSSSHLHCVFKLARFGQHKRNEALSSQLQNINTQHNIQVKKNRQVLKRLIDVICYLANQDLTFRGHNESVSSLNRGNYFEVLNFLKQYDPLLSHHFETATVFKDNLMAIQNDLIKAVGELLTSHISKNIKQSEFVAIMIDETSDILMKSHLSVVFRYYCNKKIHETFVGFIDVSSGRTTEDLFQLVAAQLERYDIKDKLVAQTYDGAAVMSGYLKELQMKVKSLWPNAIFVPCYAHVLNSVLSQGITCIRECKKFFSTLNGIATFASHSSKKPYGLKEFLKGKFPSLITTRWCFSSQLVNVVSSYTENIQQYFENIENDEGNIWESNDRMAASGYCKFLRNFETVFLLNVFSKFFSFTDVLFNLFQNPNIDIVFCTNEINKLNDFLKVQRNKGFLEIWQSTLQAVPLHIDTLKAKNDTNETKYRILFFEIVDNLIVQISERFGSFEKLKYLDLLNGNKLNNYCQKNNFPEKLIKNLLESYPNLFEYTQLKNELYVFYANTAAIQTANKLTEGSSKPTTPFDVLLWMQTNIANSFEQVNKLSKLICTVPVSTASVVHSFSARKRIKTYLRNTQGQERLSYLACMSIEKEFLKELKESHDFYNRVIENFMTVQRRNDFMYS